MSMTDFCTQLNKTFEDGGGAKKAELIAGTDVICVESEAHGNLQMFMSRQNETLVVRADLMPVPSDPDEAANLAEDMLEMQSAGAFPLSFFGKYKKEGQDTYELIGSLSADSKLSVIAQEIDMLASNAISFMRAFRNS